MIIVKPELVANVILHTMHVLKHSSAYSVDKGNGRFGWYHFLSVVIDRSSES